MTGGSAPGGGPWTAGARVYSGRADPTWPLDRAQARALLALWDALPASAHAAPRTSRLGYRGCWLRAPDGSSWVAHDGLVAERSAARGAVRDDPGRTFERALLATAPPGALPPGLVPDRPR